MLFVHGGGFRTGTARNGRQAGAHLAASTGARVLPLDYRLAPEHPYPTHLDTLGRWPEIRTGHDERLPGRALPGRRDVWPHMQHVWHLATGFLPEATEAVDRTVAFIRRVAEGRVADGAAPSGGPASFEEVT